VTNASKHQAHLGQQPAEPAKLSAHKPRCITAESSNFWASLSLTLTKSCASLLWVVLRISWLEMSPEFHTTPGLVLTLMLGIELPYSPALPELHKPIGVVVLELMLLWSRLEAVVPNGLEVKIRLGPGLGLGNGLGLKIPAATSDSTVVVCCNDVVCCTVDCQDGFPALAMNGTPWYMLCIALVVSRAVCRAESAAIAGMGTSWYSLLWMATVVWMSASKAESAVVALMGTSWYSLLLMATVVWMSASEAEAAVIAGTGTSWYSLLWMATSVWMSASEAESAVIAEMGTSWNSLLWMAAVVVCKAASEGASANGTPSYILVRPRPVVARVPVGAAVAAFVPAPSRATLESSSAKWLSTVVEEIWVVDTTVGCRLVARNVDET